MDEPYIFKMLRHFVAEDQRSWDMYLPALAFAGNRSVHRATNTTPFELTLTRAPTVLDTEDRLEPKRFLISAAGRIHKGFFISA